MRIYNTLTKKIEEFKPLKKKHVSMYVCGPTVYGYIHIGNARPVIFFDVVRNYFEFLGYEVTYVSNFTDVDDKIIAQAKLEQITEKELSEKYIKAFLDDVSQLNCGSWDANPRVTDYMDKIIDFIKKLIEKGYAYAVDGDVYFEVSKIKNYGAFSGQNQDELEDGARIEINSNKKNPSDFTLWKKTDDGINWESPWSTGRPGWHTECVTMIDTIFGDKIDIHGGGSGLKFPHHENEIAQSLALKGNKIANYWMHNGLLVLGDTKMSKSIGNIISIGEMLKIAPYQAFKLMMLTTHYRQPLVYSEAILLGAKQEWEKIERAYNQAVLKLDLNNKLDFNNLSYASIEIRDEFIEYMSNDFNTPNAITVLFKLVKLINNLLRDKDIDFNELNGNLALMKQLLSVLGLHIPYAILTAEDKQLVEAWQKYRQERNYTEADKIREILFDKGIQV